MNTSSAYSDVPNFLSFFSRFLKTNSSSSSNKLGQWWWLLTELSFWESAVVWPVRVCLSTHYILFLW
jgi:hypothetical protein